MYLIYMLITFLYLVLVFAEEDRQCDNYNNGCKPLILTALINEGQIKEARLLAEVKFNDFKNVKSYSGYFTVNEKFNSNLFFWFFPSETDYEESPVILWLQGGPGTTSMIGVFLEHGPFIVQQNLEIQLRETSWTRNHSVIYIDNPVGTGYSFTDPETYANNETVIGDHLYTALIQFFQVFPEIKNNPFYIIGESYGGKYVPAISYTILKRNPMAKLKINLQGLAIGSGFSDPEYQLKYGEYLFNIGLIDLNERKAFEAQEKELVELIHEEKWEEAYFKFSNLIYNGNNTGSLFNNYSGYNASINVLDNIFIINTEMLYYMTQDDVMSALHVPLDHEFHGEVVIQNLIPDFMQSVSLWISELLETYRILIYNGQFDIIVPYPGTVNYLNHLNFSGSDAYKNTSRTKWIVDNGLAGYAKCAGYLIEVLVRNAGHMVSVSQPERTLDLITKFTRNQSIC